MSCTYGENAPRLAIERKIAKMERTAEPNLS